MNAMFNIPTLALIVWGCLATCALWCVAVTNHSVPITLEEAELIWGIHKLNTNCTCNKWQPQKDRSGKIKGFKCECGFKYTQRKPISSRKMYLAKTHFEQKTEQRHPETDYDYTENTVSDSN
jgi:hypothetical protein